MRSFHRRRAGIKTGGACVIADFLGTPDRAAFVRALSAFAARSLVTDLRRWPFAHEAQRVAALETAATVALDEFPDNRFILATSCAALLDARQTTTVIAILRAKRDSVASSPYLMNVLARVLGIRGRRNSRAVAFRLAEQLKSGHALTPDELTWLDARLGDAFLAAPDVDEPWPQGQEALVTPQRLDGVVPVPALPGVTVRQLESRNQIERFANHLRNCLSNMRAAIEADATRVIGIERDGVPIEALEVNPRGGRLRQWKAAHNAEPNPLTRPVIESFLLELGVIRRRRPGTPG